MTVMTTADENERKPNQEEDTSRDGDRTDENASRQSQPMRFSFARAKPPATKISRDIQEKSRGEKNVELLEAVGEGKLKAIGGGTLSEEKIVPKQVNTWQIGKKPRLSFNPEEEKKLMELDTEERFVVETMSAGPLPDVKYGLLLNAGKEEKEGKDGVEKVGRGEDGKDKLSAKDLDWQRYKADMKSLADEADEEAYENMPIEDFGMAMLRGMGWEEGKAIGKHAKGPIEPVEYVPRVGRLGLGAVPKGEDKEEKDKKKKMLKPGESREPKKDLVAAPGVDGRVRHVKPIGEKLVERVLPGVQIGKIMRIIGGRHEGLKAEVLDRESSKTGKAKVKLLVNEEVVVVRVDALAVCGSMEEGKAMEELRRRERKRDKGEGDRREERRHHGEGYKEGRRGKEEREGRKWETVGNDLEAAGDRRNYDNRHTEENENGRQRQQLHGSKDDGGRYFNSSEVTASKKSSKEPVSQNGNSKASVSSSPPWLMSHIRVRVVSKSVHGGRLYLKKATIMDLSSPTVCDILVDETQQLVQNLRQDMLETALPKRGGRVAIVGGKYRGLPGKLLERNTEKGEAVVQLANSFELVSLDLDHVAEFVGEEEDGEG